MYQVKYISRYGWCRNVLTRCSQENVWISNFQENLIERWSRYLLWYCHHMNRRLLLDSRSKMVQDILIIAQSPCAFKSSAFRRNTNYSSSGWSSPNCWRCLFCLLDQSSVNFDFLFCPRLGFPFPIINIHNFSSSSLTDSCNFREAYQTLGWFPFLNLTGPL